jgi:A/G-specific adenine glycosylase
MPSSPLHEPLLTWYDRHARDLPWRRVDATPWSVMVSEFMLQQTPVARVLPVHAAWLAAWPRPSGLAAEPPGEAIRAWGRLGYPRRAVRLHAAAVAIRDRHADEVPREYDELRALPGVGDYTAAAIASFAFGRRHAVLDTNVRRVLARSMSGVEFPPTSVTAQERRVAERLLPETDVVAARWAVATMELGALVCLARNPSCGRCPVGDHCAWRQAGRPPGSPPRGQRYAGTDRQCRGRLLGVLRDTDGPVHRSRFDCVWDDDAQRARALDGLVADGLIEPLDADMFALPGATT